ncbi:polycystic kidney disease protein 1-like 3 isoform X2 [Drosophila obscura]|uniref:polycystic kidney disease protein 1-like 3 isoform X2 n=1 Tax=Drosophila obscura TaxID=7282 RepID=UPI001BB1B294|nr:polycystic kidney disease protein 1-like 3 isoform X2 [Drosophila obscura]
MANPMVFIVTSFVIITCFFVTCLGSGFNHEERKFKAILAMFIMVVVFQFLVFDPLRFLVIAIDAACWPRLQRPPVPDTTAKKHTRMDYLNLRLRSLRSQLLITERHRDEELNLKYRTIVRELWVYGKVFIINLFINVALDDYKYHNWDTITTLMNYGHRKSMGLNHVLFIHQLYPFIEHTLINGFLSNDPHRLNSHWHHINSTKLLGVIRLRQLRDTGEQFGLGEPRYTNEDYSEGWILPYVREPYTDKYWSIYLPWLPMSQVYNFWEKIVINLKQYGFYTSYPELKGYIVTLRNTKWESHKVLRYLTEKNWLDDKTAAVFIDFTLYNTDADLFSICSIRVENMPFGTIRSSVDVNTVSMTMTTETLPWHIFIFFIAYVIIWMQLGTAVIVPLWFEPKRIKLFWVKIDLAILLLSMIVVALMILKTNIVVTLMHTLEVSSTHDFIDFRVPGRINDWNSIATGFLVCLITLRLWKVMQFSSIFQVFTMTLSLASSALLNTACVICIFMMGIGIALVCINGNSSNSFRNLLSALASIMCFSFGFTDNVEPRDLFHGGVWLGILIYGIMAFTIPRRSEIVAARIRSHSLNSCSSSMRTLSGSYGKH